MATDDVTMFFYVAVLATWALWRACGRLSRIAAALEALVVLAKRGRE
jgi:hypothetical protein